MKTWSGEVDKLSSREWGNKTLWSWQLKGANLWFRVDSEPTFKDGDKISFSGESPNKIDSSTIKEISESALKAEAQKQGTDVVPPTSSPDYWRWKQMHDLEREDAFMWRDARADAVRLVCAALENDCLSLGAKKAAKLGVLQALVKEVTQDLVDEMKEMQNG